MDQLKQNFINKFKLESLEIKKVGSWIISLRPQQPTIGSCILTLNRKCQSLSLLTEIEGKELTLAFREIERMLNKSFNPDKFNYLALMMVDEQVHFHVIPRYERERKMFSKEWTDLDFPKPIDILTSLNFNEDELLEIKEYLKQNL